MIVQLKLLSCIILVLFFFSVPDYEIVRVRRSPTDTKPAPNQHNLQLRAFGKDLQFRLRRAEGLFKDDLRFWAADPNVTGEVHFTPLPPVSSCLYSFVILR